jgi:hypothetical protein
MKKMNILIALIIIVFTSNAFAGNKNEDKRNKARAKTEKVSDKFDVEMKLETWMTEIRDFNPFQKNFVEQEILMESWMTESFSLNTNDFQENEMIMEPWMIGAFENESSGLINSFDLPLNLEVWMTRTFKIN